MRVRSAVSFLAAGVLTIGLVSAYSQPASAVEAAVPHLWAWGDAGVYQLADGSNLRHYSPSGATLAPVVFAQVAASGQSAFGRTASGDVYSWGDNTNGELGLGTADSLVDTPTKVTLPGPATQVLGGYGDNGYALLANGDLYGWGSGASGALGLGNLTAHSAPVLILGNVVRVACGNGCLASLADGSVKGWGLNNWGQLGNGASSGTVLSPTTAANGLTNVLGLAVASDTGFVLTSNRTVYSFGHNDQGQLGLGTSDTSTHPTPSQIPSLSNIASIGAAGSDGFAIDAAGTLTGWGYNGSSNLGVGNANTPVTTPVHVMDNVSKVAPGFRSGLALTTAGQVYAWGDDGQSQLGNGDQASSFVPIPVTLPRAAVDIASTRGAAHSSAYAILSDPAPVTPMSQGLLAFQVQPPAGTQQVNNQPQIVLSDGTGAFARPFEQSVTADRAPAISPDGSLIAFAGPRIDGVGGSGQPNQGDDLFTATTAPANVLGEGLRRVLMTADDEDNPSWSHTVNGTLVFDHGARTGTTTHGLSTVNMDGATSALTPAGGAVGDTHPVFTPDDTHILFTRGAGSGADLWAGDYDASGPTLSNIHNLTNSSGFDGDAAISPDGKTVAWTKGTGSSARVWTAPFDGTALGAATQLPTTMPSFTPTWSPDGTKIAMGVTTTTSAAGAIFDLGSGALSILYAGKYADVRYPTWVDNLSVTTDVSSTTASPQSVPLTDLRTNGQTPANSTCTSAPSCGAVQAAPGTNPGKTPGTNPGKTPGTNPGKTPGTNPGKTPGTNPGKTPGGETGFRQLTWPADLGTNPLIGAGLAKISLASTPLAGGWAAVLAGTPLDGKPLQSVSFRDLLSIDPVPNFYLKDLDLTTSALGKISLLSYLLGDTRLADITLPGTETWCADLTAYLRTIGSSASCDAYGRRDSNGAVVSGGLDSASLLALEIEGVSLDAFPGLSALTLGDVNLAAHDGLLAEYQLRTIDLKNSSFGNLLVKDLPNDPALTTDTQIAKLAVDCNIAGVDCSATSTQTLYGAEVAALQAHAQDQTVFRTDSTILDLGQAADALTLSEVVLGFAPGAGGDPLDSINLTDLGVVGYGGAQSSTVNFEVTYAPANVYAVIDPTVTVTLPAGFTYIPGSTTMDPLVATGEPTISGQTLTYRLSGGVSPGSPMTLDFATRPGLTLGTYDTPFLGVSTADVAQVLGHAGPSVRVVPNAAQQASTLANPVSITPGTVVTGHLPTPGKVLYFSVDTPAQAGSTLDVYLDHLPVDADLLVYHPGDSKPSQPLRPIPVDTTGPVNATPDQTLGLASQGEQLLAGSSNDYPVAANLPLAGVSDGRGVGAEHVGTLTFASGGAGSHYTIEVSAYNGAQSNEPFTLRAEVTPPPGLPDVPRPAFPNTGTPGTVPSTASSVQTLILTNVQRLQAVYGTSRAQTAISAFSRLAADPTVKGLVVPVDGWADVQAAYTAWDAHPGDPELANDIVRLVNQHVDALLGTGRSALRHLVLAGTDEILPMARIPDLTQTGNERGFAGEVATYTGASSAGNNALLGAVNAGYVLSDDPYSSFAPRAILGTYLYPPSVATGRLVETPEDMANVINQYLMPTRSGDAPGVLHPSTALTTGYDFFADMAQAINTNLSTVLGGPQATLINGSWSRAALKAAFDQHNPIPDIGSINAHATPTFLVPADQATQYSSDDVAGSVLSKKILMTLGCHSGFSITDYLAANGVNDFAQASQHAGVAAFVGQTGYGLGGQAGTIAYGERLMTQFTKNLQGRTLGQALAQAKLDYLSRSPNVYDAKVLEESTFYGLPMFTIGGTATGTTLTPPTLTSDPSTGLSVSTLAVNNAVSSNGDNWRLNTVSDGSFYTLANQPQNNDGNTAVEQNRPIQPRVDLDVTEPGKTARGVLVTGLSSIEQSGFDPVLSRPTIDSSTTEPERQVASVLWPLLPQDLGTVPVLTGGQKQTASLTLARFRSTGIATSGPSVGKTIGVERRYTRVAASVYYVNSGTPYASAPTFDSTTAMTTTVNTVYSVKVHGSAGRTVKRVYVLAHDASTNGDWTGFDLTLGTDGVWGGSSAVGGPYLEYIVQAVDDLGDVASTTDTGAVFDPGGVTTNPTPGPVSLATTTSPSATGWFTSTPSVRVNGTAGVSYSLRIDGATDATGQPLYTPYAGPQPIAGEGAHTITVVGSDGGTASLSLKTDTVAPSISITSPNLGALYSLSLKKVIASYQCTDATSGVASCNGNVVVGAYLSLSSLGIKTFTVTATDNAGNTATKSVTYTVIL